MPAAYRRSLRSAYCPYVFGIGIRRGIGPLNGRVCRNGFRSAARRPSRTRRPGTSCRSRPPQPAVLVDDHRAFADVIPGESHEPEVEVLHDEHGDPDPAADVGQRKIRWRHGVFENEVRRVGELSPARLTQRENAQPRAYRQPNARQTSGRPVGNAVHGGRELPVTPRAIGPPLRIAVKPIIVPSPTVTAPLEVRTVSFRSVPTETATDSAFSTPSSARAVPVRVPPARRTAPNASPLPRAILVALVFIHAPLRNRHAHPTPAIPAPFSPAFCPSPLESRRTLSSN